MIFFSNPRQGFWFFPRIPHLFTTIREPSNRKFLFIPGTRCRGCSGAREGERTRRRAKATRLMALAFLACILFLHPLSAAPGSTLQNLIHSLETTYRDVRTLKARFVQKYRVAEGRVRIETGNVYLARGGRMRWEYQEPEEKYFITDRKKTYLYVPAERLVTRSSTQQTGDVRIPFQLLLARPKLRRVFARVELVKDLPPLESDNAVLRGWPKKTATGLREVLIEVMPNHDIRRIIIHFRGGNAMEFRFSEIRRNVPVAATEFRFTPPEGTQVIDAPQ